MSDGITHVVFDWTDPNNNDGGLGYASGPPFGPFTRSSVPITSQSTMPPLPLPIYQRVYGGTLHKRSDTDWIILSAISTRGNGGGTWGLCCMTASSPTGPWSIPILLLVNHLYT